MGIPPAEERAVSLKAIGVDDIFGCGIRPQQMLQLAEMEAAQEDKLVVILSDVQLDKPLVSFCIVLVSDPSAKMTNAFDQKNYLCWFNFLLRYLIIHGRF